MGIFSFVTDVQDASWYSGWQEQRASCRETHGLDIFSYHLYPFTVCQNNLWQLFPTESQDHPSVSLAICQSVLPVQQYNRLAVQKGLLVNTRIFVTVFRWEECFTQGGQCDKAIAYHNDDHIYLFNSSHIGEITQIKMSQTFNRI